MSSPAEFVRPRGRRLAHGRHGLRQEIGREFLDLAIHRFLIAAWQPRRVGGILPLTAVLVLCLLVSSAIDVAAGDTGLGAEVGGHATEIVGLGLLWLLARDTGQVGSLTARFRSRGHAHS